LLSFGIAGGLAPGLPPGTLISASAVGDDAGTVAIPSAISERIAGRTGARIGLVYGGPAILATAAEKERIYRATGALAVDMESHNVARAAQRAGVPFAVLRAVADPAGRALPPAALLPLTSDGRPDLRLVLGAVARRPGQIPALCRTALDARAALKALLRGGRALRAAGLLGADAGERLLDVL
jgi:adenosylhomocysteine nucleosidase